MNALKLTVFMLVVFVALATLIDAFESDEETLSVETRDVRRRQHQPHRHNKHGHNNHGHNNQNRRHRRPRICLTGCKKRCRIDILGVRHAKRLFLLAEVKEWQCYWRPKEPTQSSSSPNLTECLEQMKTSSGTSAPC
ncbi:hypothetical protein LSAT2_003984 [Lamellibrachia satsuma]|nr:hypothetical protein LSAT2_003984 [Lamellibrachia satsuma]